MATKADVFRIAKKHPDYNAVEIARVLKCRPEYVRATFYRAGLPTPNVDRETLAQRREKIRSLTKKLAKARAQLAELEADHV